jgi:ribonuclease HI
MSWSECAGQVNGYSGAVFRAFSSLEEARRYLKSQSPEPPGLARLAAPEPAARETGAALLLPQEQPLETGTRRAVTIYADGACTGNPGPGGYGVVLIHGSNRKELSAGFRLTTNNRMEILGCIAGLQALKCPCDATVYSDSKYVVNAMSKQWALKWKSRGWKRRLENGELKDALNADLWARMLELCDIHRVSFSWVRGHSGVAENERCDELARAAAAEAFGIDTAYENPSVRR